MNRKRAIFKIEILIKRSLTYLCLLVISGLFTKAQDIHFSQYDGSLLNHSPAFTGFFNGDYRVGAIYRSQWQSVPVPYSTFSMNGEARFRPKQFEKDAVGVSVLFNNDKAGDTRYGTTQLYIGGSYIYTTFDSTLLVSIGMNLGWCQVGFDYQKMTFDSQFDGLQHNSSFSSNEKFDWIKYNYADINLGSAVQYRFGKNYFTYGLGLHHLATPVITYQGNKMSKLDFKLANYMKLAAPVHPKIDVIAEGLFNKQGKYFEFIPHVSAKYYLSRDLNQAVLGGVCLRARDAVVLRMGYHYRTMQSGIAYDINTSRFVAATNRRGAFEIFINYIIKNKPAALSKKRVCPVFM